MAEDSTDEKRQGTGVILINPIESNINLDVDNGIPQYQDMHIYAELVAKRRNRSVLIKTGNYVKNDRDSIGDERTYNFLGIDQDKESPHYGNFSTNYYDGSVGSRKQYEGFGITKINVVTNSSFIPQINIQFKDVRGVAFFNREDSPYRMLFDFPPPIFSLTIKGYYGKMLTYQLHLVKYNTEFNSGDGSFTIDCEFIAMTYAPLTDVLFKYIINFPLIDQRESLDDDASNAPTNTFQLLTKVKNVYSVIKEKIAGTQEKESFDDSIKMISRINDYLTKLYNYKDDNKLNKNQHSPILFMEEMDDIENIEFQEIKEIKNFGNYDRAIKTFETSQIPSNPPRLYIGFKIKGVPMEHESGREKYNNYRNELIKGARNININILENDIVSANFISKHDGYEYYGIELSNYYVKLLKQREIYEYIKQTSSNGLNELINALIDENLGMKPTIYNIFKIILDDVDFFFEKMRKTAQNAEEFHEENYESIVNEPEYVDVKGKIYAFPLIIEHQEDCGNVRQRVAPTELSKRIGREFPELTLVNNFIDTFLLYNRILSAMTLREDVDETGRRKWIAIAPFDTKTFNTNLNGPFYTIDPVVSVSVDQENKLNKTLENTLKRFYVYSQYVYSKNFYKRKQLRSFFAESEAINIVNSIANDNILLLLENFSQNLKSNPNAFYEYLEENLNVLYDFENRDFIQLEGVDHYINRNNENFQGTDIRVRFNPPYKSDVENSENLIDQYFLKRKWFEIWKTTLLPGQNFVILDENIPFSPENKDANESNFIFQVESTAGITEETAGNKKTERNINKIWGGIFNNFRNKIGVLVDNDFLNYDEKVSVFVFLSNFASNISPYSSLLIEFEPSILSVSRFYPAYIGGLIIAHEDEAFRKKIYNYFESLTEEFEETGLLRTFLESPKEKLRKTTLNGFNNLKKDIENNINFLSENDKTLYRNKFYEFMDNGFQGLMIQIKDILLDIPDDYVTAFNDNGVLRDKLLEPKDGWGIFTDIAFKRSDNVPENYISLKNLNSTNNLKTENDEFFNEFFSTLYKEANNKREKFKEQEIEFKSLSGDKDIITRTYYSFKNINDKWLVNPNADARYGYPFNRVEPDSRLINLFAFVDRGMNPIGNTIINPEILLDFMEDNNATIFTVISQILSVNGFEFFPLQNFMSFTSGEWEESFKVTLDNEIPEQEPNFVCMYIGGSSSLPTGINYGRQYEDDGIIDLKGEGLETSSECEPVPEDDNQKETNKKLKYGNVNAFRVKFGEQNQSMFKDINIESNEYPETNESIQILSQLAGDDRGEAPVPKGQNLYNLYENRAYKATISGLGNASIQPTQYFQLENVPLYNGAYVILSVEHNIEPNKMMTSFSGTKILKYPIPRVLDPATAFGFEGGSSTITNPRESSSNIASTQRNILEIDDKTNYNSMFTFKI